MHIAIDTNVFLHLLNPQNNADNHIGKLLAILMKLKATLVIDTHRKIVSEYGTHISRLFRTAAEVDDGRNLLKYWMDPSVHEQVPVDLQGAPMKAISKIMRL